MKFRNPLVPKIKLVHSRRFWHKCFNCGIEFKNADMWKYSFEFINSAEVLICDRYSCTKCSPTKEDAMTNLMSTVDYNEYLKVEKNIKDLK